ncbi:hypothetical protein THF1D04_10500 [Vibrio owensii]|uniref:Uncharacterized protein n=1 Tax=Vibrio owensii TaxID=696485 RepID=A0AAU9PYF9_9VIBR|nr:hypothetical protein THF1D04_10500 [Vibrio owensii]
MVNEQQLTHLKATYRVGGFILFSPFSPSIHPASALMAAAWPLVAQTLKHSNTQTLKR